MATFPVVAAGIINSVNNPDLKITYTIYDTLIDTPAYTVAGVQPIVTQWIGAILRNVGAVAGQNSYIKVNSFGRDCRPWNNEQLKYQHNAMNSGFAFGFGEYKTPESRRSLNDGGRFSNGYRDFYVMAEAPWFLVGVNTGKTQGSSTMNRIEHEFGNYIECNGARAANGKPNGLIVVVTETGDIYIMTQELSYFGYVTDGSEQWNEICLFQPMRWYNVRATPNIVRGTVHDAAGAPASDCIVRMYNRANGKLVGETKSDASGEYEVHCVAGQGEEVYGVCLDNGKGQKFEGVVVDRIKVE